MNVLLNTPILKSDSIKQDFDNKVLLVFMLIIFIFVITGLLFIELTRQYTSRSVNNDDNENPPRITRFA